MTSDRTKILLVEDDPGDVRLIREMLAEVEETRFDIEWVPRLSDTLERLSNNQIDLVLLDLGLPDSRGLETFLQAYAHSPRVPFVVLSGLNDETLALKAVREGAQDYLIKGETDSGLLLRAIRYATERKKVLEALQQAHAELEQRVDERTAELVLANQMFIEEIEKRKETEAALQVSEERYKTIFENTGTATIIIEADRTICLANSEFEKLSGFPKVEIEGKKTIDEFISAADLENIREFRHLRCTEPSVSPGNYEFYCQDREGRIKEISLTASMIPGTFQSVCSVLDITARKEAERALKLAHANLRHEVARRTAELAEANAVLKQEIQDREQAQAATEAERRRLFSLLDELPGFVYLLAPDYSIRFANRVFRELFGEPGSNKCYEVLKRLPGPCPECKPYSIFQTGQPQTYEWPGFDGRVYLLHDYPFTEADGSLLVLVLGTDISRSRQAE